MSVFLMRHKVCNFEVYLAWFVLYGFSISFLKLHCGFNLCRATVTCDFFLSYVYDRVFVKINEDVVVVGGG